MLTHFRAFEDSQSLFSSRYQKVLKVRIYNITHFATKMRIFIMVGLLHVYYMIPFPRRYI